MFCSESLADAARIMGPLALGPFRGSDDEGGGAEDQSQAAAAEVPARTQSSAVPSAVPAPAPRPGEEPASVIRREGPRVPFGSIPHPGNMSAAELVVQGVDFFYRRRHVTGWFDYYPGDLAGAPYVEFRPAPTLPTCSVAMIQEVMRAWPQWKSNELQAMLNYFEYAEGVFPLVDLFCVYVGWTFVVC